jgi:hypothetical protein
LEIAPAAVDEAYHFHAAPVPKVPADTLRVELVPEQIAAAVAAGVGFDEAVLTVSVHRLLATLTAPSTVDTRHERIVALSETAVVRVNEAPVAPVMFVKLDVPFLH